MDMRAYEVEMIRDGKSEIFLHSEYGNNGDRTPSDKIFNT